MRLRLNSRMRAGFAAMSVLLLVGGLIVIGYTYRIQTATRELLKTSVQSLRAAEALELAIELLGGTAHEDLLNLDSTWRQTIEEHKAGFRTALKQAEASSRTPQQLAMLSDLTEEFVKYAGELTRALELDAAGQHAASVAAIGRALAIASDMHEVCEEFEGSSEEAMNSDLGAIDRANRRMRFAMYGLAAGGLLLGMSLSMMMARSIRSPIRELVLKVRDATGHQVVERIDLLPEAELEDLDRHVEQLIQRMNATRADLESSQRQLQRSERLAALGRISAGVAHEIRNPLTSIKMLIYALGEDATLHEERRRDLEVISKEIDRMDRFVDNFLKFARPQDPQLVPVDPNQVVRETMDLLAPSLGQANIRRVEIYASELRSIAADADQLRQVLMNLVLNAVAAMPRGGSLTIETRRPRGPDGTPGAGVQILVKDTGAGIPADLLDTLFDPFVSGRQDGVGMGLAISHQIVLQHGGWIDAVNDPEGGATFIVSLPEERGHDHAQGTGGGRRGERPLLVPQDPA